MALLLFLPDQKFLRGVAEGEGSAGRGPRVNAPHRRWALVLALFAMALAGPAQAGAVADSEESTSRLAVWTQPLLTTLFLVTELDEKNFFVPVGVSYARPGGRTWVFEASYFRYRNDAYDTLDESEVLSFSFGPRLPWGTSGQLRGGFIQPEFVTSVFRNRGAFYRYTPNEVDVTLGGAALQVGADVGYEFRLGSLYVAPVIGARVGLAWNNTSVSVYPWGGVTPRRVPGPGLVADVNLNLLRIGASF